MTYRKHETDIPLSPSLASWPTDPATLAALMAPVAAASSRRARINAAVKLAEAHGVVTARGAAALRSAPIRARSSSEVTAWARDLATGVDLGPLPVAVGMALSGLSGTAAAQVDAEGVFELAGAFEGAVIGGILGGATGAGLGATFGAIIGKMIGQKADEAEENDEPKDDGSGKNGDDGKNSDGGTSN